MCNYCKYDNNSVNPKNVLFKTETDELVRPFVTIEDRKLRIFSTFFSHLSKPLKEWSQFDVDTRVEINYCPMCGRSLVMDSEENG